MIKPLIDAIDLVQTLGKGAGQVRALKGVSLALSGGELTLLMGPSGSGKTTLLSVLGCMLTPTEGTVHIRGHSTAGARPGELAKLRRDHIGFIFQSYRLFPMLNALDNVRLSLDVRGENSDQSIARSKDALDMVGLSHKVASFPREMSGGEQQRVAIARAIVGNPSAILADEPTGALDSENGLAIMNVLAEIAKDPSRAVLVVTHDPRVTQFADRIIHIEDGRISSEDNNYHASEVFSVEDSRREMMVETAGRM
jgi:putative ABC transport system ATP-binding protein